MGVSKNKLNEIDNDIYEYIRTHIVNGGCRISYKELALQSDYSVSTVMDSIKRLNNNNRIIVIKDEAHGIYRKGTVRLVNVYKVITSQ